MRMCQACHDSLGCEQTHPRIVIHSGAGPACGVCSKGTTEMECFSPAANEIDSYNRALHIFGLSMRRKFILNMGKGKGGWRDIQYDYAIKRLLQEAGELSAALMHAGLGGSSPQEVDDEASDVANFAFFIGYRALQDDARNRAVIAQADEAWVAMRRKNGECLNKEGPCDTPGNPVESYCEVCKAKLAKRDTERREVKT
jgi:hypothetical protein